MAEVALNIGGKVAGDARGWRPAPKWSRSEIAEFMHLSKPTVWRLATGCEPVT